MKDTKNFYYIAELYLPSSSAYTVHVMKIFDRFADKFINSLLIIPYINKKYKKDHICNDFNLKNKISIKNFQRSNKNNFLLRIFFSLKVLFFFLKKFNEKKIIYSRSIISSLLLSVFQIKNYLEIHHDIKGFTKFLYFITNFKLFRKNIKFVFLHKNLNFLFQTNEKQTLILDDAVELIDFNYLKFRKNFFFFSCGYFGGLTKGKGLEIIVELAKRLKNIVFIVYGDVNFIYDKKILKKYPNIIFKGYVNYKNIPKEMQSCDILLLPYLNQVKVRSNNLDTSKYMSPLKLFEYMAAKKLIIASKLKVYSHILKDKRNCFLLDNKNINLWEKKIKEIIKNKKKYDYIIKNSYLTVKEYTWKKRVDKILMNF